MQPHIYAAHIKGYKSLYDTSIEMSAGLNIIIGANGSGKTNFASVVEKVFNATIKKNEVESGELRFWGHCNVLKKDEYGNVLRTLITEFIITSEIGTDKKNINGQSVFYRFRNLNVIRFNLPQNNIEFTDYTNIYYLLENNSTMLYNALDGHDKYDYYYKIITGLHQKENYATQDFDTFTETLQIPTYLKNKLSKFSPIQDIKFDISRVNILKERRTVEVQNLRYLFFVDGKWLQWSQLSDGTKRLFYIISHLTMQEECIFIIEEPELGVHPHQLQRLMQFIKQESEKRQIILTTHAPQVLNILNSDELDRIIVCEMTEDGTKMRHLTDKQRKRAQKYMQTQLSLGDYWLYADLEPQNMLRE